MDILQVVTGFVLGLAFIAPFFLKAKSILKEVSEALSAISAALDDGSINLPEAKRCLEELNDIVLAVKK
jgi:hypothetical protein